MAKNSQTTKELLIETIDFILVFWPEKVAGNLVQVVQKQGKKMFQKILVITFTSLVLGSIVIDVNGQTKSSLGKSSTQGNEETTYPFDDPDLSESEKEEWLQGNFGRHPVVEEDDTETKKLKQRANIAWLNILSSKRAITHTVQPIEFIVAPFERLIVAELELFEKHPIKIEETLKEAIKVAKNIEATVRSEYREGKRPTSDLTTAVYCRMSLEIQLQRVEAKKDVREQ